MGLNEGYLTSNRSTDELYSPFYIVDPILKYLPKDKKIWCPFDEEWSAFYIKLKEEGFDVIRSSLSEGKDFFEYEPENWDIIVSNPPFTKKDKVLDRLYSFDKPFAILLPLNSLQGISRYKCFSQGIQMLAFDSRVGYHNELSMNTMANWNSFATVYFCRDLLPEGLIVEKLNKYQRSLLIV